jgi:predicted dehydrogenase
MPGGSRGGVGCPASIQIRLIGPSACDKVDTMKTISFGVVGIHGFSRAHIHWLEELLAQGKPVRFPVAVAHARHLDESYAVSLEQKGVRLLPDFQTLLVQRNEVDVITLPVGIPLHVSLALPALDAGFHVYLEKPVAGDIADGLTLAEAARRASGCLFIGYQDLFQPPAWNLKRLLLSRSLGSLRRIVVMAAWPRAASYYARNHWAGKLRVNGTWVFDSPVNNACAHYLNLALFWAGSTEPNAASPVAVTAELARAKPIESADTTALRVETREGPEILFAASHACATARGPLFRLECERGTILTQRGNGRFDWTIHIPNRPPETRDAGVPMVNPFDAVAQVLNGEEVPVCTLDQALAQTRAVNGAFLSSPVQTAPSDEIAVEEASPGDPLIVIRRMNEILEACFENGYLPSETGLAPWIKTGRRVAVEEIRRFEGLPSPL